MTGTQVAREPGACRAENARRIAEESSHLAGSFAPAFEQISLRMTFLCREVPGVAILSGMDMQERLVSELHTAMKERDAGRVSVLRMAKAALKNREIEKGAPLDDGEAQLVFQSLVKQRQDSIAHFKKAGRAELADKEEFEIEVLRRFLPEEASQEEIDAAVDASIQETSAATPKDIGRVMKVAMTKLRLGGKPVDGHRVNALVRARLGG